MTVKEMRKLLKGLNPEIQIQIPYGETMFRPVCNGDSGVMPIIHIDEDGSEHVVGEILMLMPCLCNESSEDAIEELAISSLNNPNSEQ